MNISTELQNMVSNTQAILQQARDTNSAQPATKTYNNDLMNEIGLALKRR